MTYFDQPALAIPRFSEAIRLLEGLDEPSYLAGAFNARGIVYGGERRYEEAHADYARARTAYALSNNTLGLARVDNNEAILDSWRGHPAEALPLFERAGQTFERFGALEKLGSTLINQVSAHLELLHSSDALAVYETAERKLAGLQDLETLRILWHQGAESLAANGRIREARDLLDRVFREANPSREKFVIAVGSRLQAQLDFADGRPNSAIPLARQTIEFLLPSPRAAGESAAALVILTRALRAVHQGDAARSETQRFSTWAKSVDAPVAVTLRVRLVEAEQAWSEGHRALAIQRHEEALQLAAEYGTPADLAEVIRSYGSALLDAGEIERATGVIGRIGRWAGKDFFVALLQARLYQALAQGEAWRSAMEDARALAGERPIPPALASPPSRVATAVR